MTFQEFLTYAQGPGINAIIGFALTFVVEWFPRWEDIDRKIKRLVFFLSSLIIPVIAALLSVVAGYQQLDFAATIWPCLVAGFAAFITGTFGYKGITKIILRKTNGA